jgi:hypothetical protein
MIEIQRDDKKWVKFYPILSHDFAGDGYTFDTRPLAEIEEEVHGLSKGIYGRFAGGVAGYTIWWQYGAYPKNRLRELKAGTTQ